METERQSLVRRAQGALRPYLRLNKSIYILFLATVVNSVGIFVYPFMTLILTRRMGLEPKAAGMAIMALSLAYIPGGLIGGKLSDRFGRKKVMALTQLVSAAAFIPCGFLGGSPFMTIFVGISLLFDGITDPARNAMNMDLTTPEDRQTAYSLLYLGHNLGFALGPLIAGFLFNHAPQWLFWGNAAAIFLATALVMAFVPETKPSKEAIEASFASNSTERAEHGGTLKALMKRPLLLAYVLITALFGFAYAQHRFLLPLQTDQALGSAGAPLYGALMTGNALMVVFLNIPIIALLKRLNPVINTAISGFLYAIGFGMLAFTGSPAGFFLSTFIWTAGEIVGATNIDVYMANHTPMSHRARFNALFPIIWGLGWSTATPISGALSERVGIEATWLVVAAVAALGAFGVLTLDRAEKRKKGSELVPEAGS